MATFLARMLGLTRPTDPTDGDFEDIADNYHRENIRAISVAGVTLGCNTEGTLFCPDRYVTRAEMASFLARALKLRAPSDPTAGDFEDIVGTVHRDDIRAVSEADIAQACDVAGLLFCPARAATRAGMANSLARSLQRNATASIR